MYSREYYISNKDSIGQKTRQLRLKNRGVNVPYLEDLKSAPCTDCGHRFPSVCMDFDHVRGVKKAHVGLLVQGSRLILDEEIAKCELVCSNCHRIRTARRAGWNKELEVLSVNLQAQ